MVRRLLADPFAFPIQFKSWLVSYLESSDMNLPISAVNGLTDILGVAGIGGGTLGILPAGIVLPYGALAAPSGSLLCDGASYLKADYQRLSDAIGTIYGSADALHFNVPDLRGRVTVGRGTNATVDALGDNEGRALASRYPYHGHTYGVHTHDAPSGLYFALMGAGGSGVNGFANVGGSGRSVDQQQTTTGPSAYSIGPGLPADNTPAYLTLNFIIIA